jgi:hypothetical protein
MAIDWMAVSAVATVGAAVAAVVYVCLTYGLWKAAAAQVRTAHTTRETELMLRLMTDYDRLRPEVNTLRQWWGHGRERDEMFRLFRDESNTAAQRGELYNIDEARYALSRFFVRIRKLAKKEYLSEDVIVAALDAKAIAKVFLEWVDPLDELVSGPDFQSTDREYFSDLLRRRYQGVA